MNVAVIPARGGSRRIPRKNIKPFHGKPIIAYSIEAAKRSGVFGKVIVSTEDREIKEIAVKYGAEIHHRALSQCEDNVGTQEVTRAVIEELVEDGIAVQFACCIYATAPMLSDLDLFRGFAAVANPAQEHAFAMAVGREPLRDVGMMYWGKPRGFLERWPLIDTYTAMIPIPETRAVDINTKKDWREAERMYAALHNEVGT